jgi:hypothetical protein
MSADAGREDSVALKSMLAATLLVVSLTSSIQATTGDGRGYYAVLDGRCEQLIADDKDVTPVCGDKLVNVDLGNGRVSFAFTSTTGGGSLVTAFTGGRSYQSSMGSYTLYVDEVATTDAANGRKRQVAHEAVEGMCTMAGDPMNESALFECWAENSNIHTRGVFRSQGRPAVVAGRAER